MGGWAGERIAVLLFPPTPPHSHTLHGYNIDLCPENRTPFIDVLTKRTYAVPPLSVAIRPARPEDAALLTALAHAAKRHWGYPERWIQAWKEDLTLTPAFIRDNAVFAAFERGQMAGCYALGLDGRRCSLEHFWVRPEAMGRGVGRALFEHALAQAAALGADHLEIEADPHAEGFYLRMGARRVGEKVYTLENHPRVLPVLVKEV